MLLFHRSPAILDGIQFGSIRGKTFNLEPSPLGFQIVGDFLGPMGGKAVPDEEELLAMAMLLEIFKETDRLVGIEASGNRADEEA